MVVRWCVERGDKAASLIVSWCEYGGPPVSPPARQGFGTVLLRRFLAGVETPTLHFDPGGIHCELRISLRQKPHVMSC